MQSALLYIVFGQVYYSKIYSMSKSIKETLRNDLSYDDLEKEFYFGGIINHTKSLFCDTFSENMIRKYFNKVIRKGDYFTFEGARWMVQSYNFRQDREERLLDSLNLISKHGGIDKTLSILQKNKLSDKLSEVKRSLKDLDDIYVNPVTIPRRWGISHIPNPMRAYYDSMNVSIVPESFIERLEEYLAN